MNTNRFRPSVCVDCRRYGPGAFPRGCAIEYMQESYLDDTAGNSRAGFETVEAARAENRLRVASLRRQAAREGSWARELGLRKSHLAALADELERRELSACSDGNPACLPEKRAYRRQMLGVEMLLFGEGVEEELSTFTLLNSSWRVPAATLVEFHPGRVLGSFRQHLNRCGILEETGFLIVYLDCEFEPVEETFVFHLHGIGDSSKVEALRLLRFKTNWGYVKTPTASAPLVIKPIRDLASQLPYLDKGFILSKGVRQVGTKLKRDRRGQRLEEPFHSLYLLWLSRLRNEDLRLFSGIRMLPCGHLRRM